MRKGWSPKREKEEGKKYSWKKEKMLAMQKALLSLTISKALTTALGKIRRAIKRVAKRNNKHNNNNGQNRLMLSPLLEALSPLPSFNPSGIPPDYSVCWVLASGILCVLGTEPCDE